MELSKISIHSWIQEEDIKTEGGKPLDFHNHRYLFDVYADQSNYLCCIKAGQIGFSTMAILKTIWLCRNRRMNVGYILPTVEMVQKFVGSKVNGIASQNAQIGAWMKDKDSITLKQIDRNFIHYLGAQTERSAIMLSLDILVVDEIDKAPQDILDIYDSRLQHSEFGYKWVFSNPTHPDFGVDRFWNMSDKKMWHITHSCGKKYVMDETTINYTTEQYQCPICKNVITAEEIRMGEWVATSVGIWSGYWIPLWINPAIPASKIAEYKRTKTPEYFYNFVAGLPYVNANDKLSEQSLLKCLTIEPNLQSTRTIIGLDTGHNLHYIMLNKDGVFYNGYCESVEENKQSHKFPASTYDPYDEIERRLVENPRSILVADQGGDLIGIRKLQAKYIGRVFLVWFTKETRNKELMRWGEGDEYGKVLADRNRVMQMVVDEINERRLVFNGTKEDWSKFIEHALNIYRVKEIVGNEEDPQYNWRYVWKRNVARGGDHLFLALCYAIIGLSKFRDDLAQIINKTNMMSGIPTAYEEGKLMPFQGKIIRAQDNFDI